MEIKLMLQHLCGLSKGSNNIRFIRGLFQIAWDLSNIYTFAPKMHVKIWVVVPKTGFLEFCKFVQVVLTANLNSLWLSSSFSILNNGMQFAIQ